MWAFATHEIKSIIYLFIYFIHLFNFVPENDHWAHKWPQMWISGIISYGKQMIHTVFPCCERKNEHLPYRRPPFWILRKMPPEVDDNLFAMVFETLMPIPTTMPNLKNLAPSARFTWIPLRYNVRALSAGALNFTILNSTNSTHLVWRSRGNLYASMHTLAWGWIDASCL